MATAAGDSTPYGGGAGGKFLKRPLRKPQPTPYDRPPTSLRRNTTTNSGGGGWRSLIVDPASRLITSTAHSLFSSIFRKRLLPAPPQEEEVAPLENHVRDATEVPSRTQEREMIEGNTQCNGSMVDGVEELEHILKQKTFTRSEIGRLTELLHSRTVEKTFTEGQRRLELTPSGPLDCHSRHKEFFGTAFGNGVNPPEFQGTVLTPAARSKVNVHDIASPTELAKAYMGIRSSRVSPSTLSPISKTVREETPAFTALKLYGPSVSTVQKSFSPDVTSQKDFFVPRARGRSAIYSMARAPYSRVQSTATKGPGTNNDALDGHSVSSSQKVLKRRCSVLENDIGSVGPIRRTRQKSNLLYSRTSGLASSAPFNNATPSGVGEASSSRSQEDRGEKGIPASSSHVSSKSIEMGQRILQQLEKFTTPKEKSNEKKSGYSGGKSAMELTPSMLHGQARKSLETFDSLKYVHHGEDGGKKVDSVNASCKVQDFAAKQQDRFYGGGIEVLGNSSSKFYLESDEASIADNDVMVITKNTAPLVPKTDVDVPRKSPAFQMSAYEDYLDLDDDTQMNGVASPSIVAPKSSIYSNGKLSGHPFAEVAKADGPAFPGMESSSIVLKNAITMDSSNAAEKGIGHSFSTDAMSNKTTGSFIPSLKPVNTLVADKTEKPASTINLGFKSSDNVSPLLTPSPAVESSTTKDVTSSVFSFAAAPSDDAIKSSESNKKSPASVNLFKQSDNTLSSATGSFAAPPPVVFSSQSASSGSSAYSTFTTSTIGVSATKFGAVAAGSAAAISGNSNSNNLADSVAFPSSQATFRVSSATSNLSALASSGTDTAGNFKQTDSVGLTNGNLSGAAISVTTQGSAISSFQFGAPTTSSNNSQLPDSQNLSSKSVFGDQNFPFTPASATASGSVPSQPAASILPALSGSSSLPTNSGSLTTVSAPFSGFGSSFSGSSPLAASGGTSSSSTSIFNGSSQPTNSPVLGSVLKNSSSGLSFGTSSASTPLSSAASGVAFETSTVSAPASTQANGSSVAVSFASFTSNAAATSSSSAPGFTFGASAPSSSSILSSGLTFGTSSTPAPANASTNGVSFGASSISAASGSTPSVFAFGASSSAYSSAATSSTLSLGASSTSAPASSSAPSPFSFGASSATASSSAPSPFSFVAAPSGAPSTTFSFGASSASAPSSAPSTTFSFGASSTSASSSALSSAFAFGASSSPPSSPFSFGASTASASSSTLSSPFSFGVSTPSATAAPAPTFTFGSAASTPPASTALQPSQPAFGNSNSVFGFGSSPSPSPLGFNSQMSSMEDSMVEDSMQSPTVATPTPVFGQSPTNNFSFGMGSATAPAPAGANPFQFSGQQNPAAAPPNPFQASGSFDGGSFSLGHGGNDKSARRIVKVKSRNRKK